MTNHRGATRHDILPGGRYPGQDLYDVLLARCERAEAEVERLRAEIDRLNGLVRQAFDAIDSPILHKGPKHFMRYPCFTCGGEVSNAGFARKSHERGKVHQAALARDKAN